MTLSFFVVNIMVRNVVKVGKVGIVMKQDKFIWTAKVGDKGQIVIPKEARDVFNIKNGDTLILFGDTKRGIAIGKYEDYLEFAQSLHNIKDNK